MQSRNQFETETTYKLQIGYFERSTMQNKLPVALVSLMKSGALFLEKKIGIPKETMQNKHYFSRRQV